MKDARIVPGPARAIHLHFLVDPSPGRSRGQPPGIAHVATVAPKRAGSSKAFLSPPTGECGNGARVEPVRHRQTKGAATDMFGLQPPRHTPTLPFAVNPPYV